MPSVPEERNSPIIPQKMRDLRIPLRVVFYREDGVWIAHCLEFDLMGHGKTAEAALEMLTEAIRLQIEVTLHENNPENLFKPADGKFFAMFAAGKNFAVGEVHIKMDSITIDETVTREFVGSRNCGEPAYA